jgi:ABC-type multidrug transport system fused ATPase/permease subunit
MAVPIFLPVLIFFTNSKLGNQLTAAKAFTTIALFNLLQFPFIFLPLGHFCSIKFVFYLIIYCTLGLAQYSQSLVSCDRMMKFFAMEELEDYVIRTSHTIEKENNEVATVVISMKNANLGWLENEEKPNIKGSVDSVAILVQNKSTDSKYTKAEGEDNDEILSEDETKNIEEILVNRSIETLTNMNFVIEKGDLVAVVGPVGSGKSSFLSALLGEMHLKTGSVQTVGSIAYCDQRPWVLNDTLQGNILFGRPYDEERFDHALFAANLEDDIQVLPGGIQTQIGERGINLSGGQKARVSLARAIYCDAG